MKAAVAQLEKLGATVKPISLPNTEHCLSVYYLLATPLFLAVLRMSLAGH